MNIARHQIDQFLKQAIQINTRAAALIASSQSTAWPHQHVDHGTRIFCAVLADQGRQLTERAIKQMGLTVGDAENVERESKAEAFFDDAARFVGTDALSMETGRVSALQALLNAAQELVARGERVLEGLEDLQGKSLFVGGFLG